MAVRHLRPEALAESLCGQIRSPHSVQWLRLRGGWAAAVGLCVLGRSGDGAHWGRFPLPLADVGDTGGLGLEGCCCEAGLLGPTEPVQKRRCGLTSTSSAMQSGSWRLPEQIDLSFDCVPGLGICVPLEHHSIWSDTVFGCKQAFLLIVMREAPKIRCRTQGCECMRWMVPGPT